jgi:hypothetical protein
MKNLLLGLAVSFTLFACGSSEKPKNEEEEFLNSLEKMTVSEPSISEEVIADIIQQIPAPLEISMLLKNVGTKYDKDLLNSTDNVSQYNSNYQKALNLGIYGTDLGYTNIYEQNQDALFYLNAIKGLADDMSIGQFFDFGTIKRLATNSRNLDSLLLITTQNFNNINTYLQDQQRSNLSILILTGGWLEALHITAQVYDKAPHDELKERIGEQKIILENILLLLSFYQNSDPNINLLVTELQGLKKAFSEVTISYEYKESTMKEVDGVLVIEDNSTSKIEITEENIDNISAEVKKVRSKIIS